MKYFTVYFSDNNAKNIKNLELKEALIVDGKLNSSVSYSYPKVKEVRKIGYLWFSDAK